MLSQFEVDRLRCASAQYKKRFFFKAYFFLFSGFFSFPTLGSPVRFFVFVFVAPAQFEGRTTGLKYTPRAVFPIITVITIALIVKSNCHWSQAAACLPPRLRTAPPPPPPTADPANPVPPGQVRPPSGTLSRWPCCPGSSGRGRPRCWRTSWSRRRGSRSGTSYHFLPGFALYVDISLAAVVYTVQKERLFISLNPDVHVGKFCLSHMFALLLCHTLLQPKV